MDPKNRLARNLKPHLASIALMVATVVIAPSLAHAQSAVVGA